jgi:hypothetical protein
MNFNNQNSLKMDSDINLLLKFGKFGQFLIIQV